MRVPGPLLLCLLLAACGAAYHSPAVRAGSGAAKVRVVPVTAETLLEANRAAYRPAMLPGAFFATAGTEGARSAAAAPEPAVPPPARPAEAATRLPPPLPDAPYRIGVGDVLLLAAPSAGAAPEAGDRRQAHTVQDDGAIAVPDLGRVPLAGRTLEEAEAELFRRLLERGVAPALSLEIAEFNSQKVSVGGAVRNPAVAPIRLAPLYLDEAIAAAGGVETREGAVVRLYRGGALYQIPLAELFNGSGLRRIRLAGGDSVFVDAGYDLDRAQAWFAEQIRLAEFRQGARAAALDALAAEVSLRRAEFAETRGNFEARLKLDAVARDHAYLAGEVARQGRFPLPFGRTASLADALYEAGGGVAAKTGDAGQIYVLRGSPDPREFGAVTAWHLDARNAAHLVLATRFELRPGDVVFVAEQPVTRWNRVVSQITPQLLTLPVRAGE